MTIEVSKAQFDLLAQQVARNEESIAALKQESAKTSEAVYTVGQTANSAVHAVEQVELKVKLANNNADAATQAVADMKSDVNTALNGIVLSSTSARDAAISAREAVVASEYAVVKADRIEVKVGANSKAIIDHEERISALEGPAA